jgi:hypothetical protein
MTKFTGVSIICALALACTTVTADEDELNQCRSIKGDLNKLENLRKGGGTAKKMDRWKRQIHDKQDEYSRLHCRAHRFELD